jgi:hypothetical protein
LIDVIDWAIAENGRKDSQYYNRIDTAKIAVMGHSRGGIQALAVAADPRIKLIGNWSCGLFVAPPNGAAGMAENVPKEHLQKLHSPVFYISGDSTNIAYENASMTIMPWLPASAQGAVNSRADEIEVVGDLGRFSVRSLLCRGCAVPGGRNGTGRRRWNAQAKKRSCPFAAALAALT